MIRPPRHPIARLLLVTAVPAAVALAVVSAMLGALTGPAPHRRGPAIPEPRAHLGEWVGRHSRNVSRAMAGHAPLLFLGDSITRGWLGPSITGDGRSALPIWESRFAPRRAENFGSDGDHVEHLLWRIRYGELAVLEPAAVVLLIGTNNIGLDPPEAIADGVAAVVDEIHRRSPESVVIVMGLLPRGLLPGHGRPAISDEPDPRIAEINQLLAPLADRPRVTFLDIGSRLLGENGRVDRHLQPDLLHLSADGYAIWAEAIEPTIRLLLGPPPGGDSAGDPALLPGGPAG